VITICPSCNTRFRVTPEQLAVRQGLVRCGRCSATFNAFATLQREEIKDHAEAPPQQAKRVETQSVAIDGLSGHVEGTLPEPRWTPAIDSHGAAEVKQDPQPTIQGIPLATFQGLEGRIDRAPPLPTWMPCDKPVQEGWQETAISQRATASHKDAVTADRSVDKPLSEEALAEFASSLANVGLDAKSPVQEVLKSPYIDMPQPESILVGPEISKPAPPKRRGGWITLCLIMCVLLIGQTIYLLRTEIAANWPETKPYLTSLCERLGCNVPLPRQLDQITIEASEMQADTSRSNVLLVIATLRNRGVIPQAYPLLEVTLTDTLERAIARRSLTVAEYLDGAPKENEGLAPNSEVVSRTAIETVDIKPAGYRLQLYYR
jgi:predicted Zn finger-like uncharacterized protein